MRGCDMDGHVGVCRAPRTICWTASRRSMLKRGGSSSTYTNASSWAHTARPSTVNQPSTAHPRSPMLATSGGKRLVSGPAVHEVIKSLADQGP